LPKAVSQFQHLTTLGIFNNQLASLPFQVSDLKELKVLYIDNNPVVTVFPEINQLNNLETLGIINTYVPEPEISKIKQLLPNCNVVSK
jgi:Leucine-rich repeat (LRR) protein